MSDARDPSLRDAYIVACVKRFREEISQGVADKRAPKRSHKRGRDIVAVE